jgi:hypothetical protein
MLDSRSKEILNDFSHSEAFAFRFVCTIKVQIPLRLEECVSPLVYLLALPLAFVVQGKIVSPKREGIAK